MSIKKALITLMLALASVLAQGHPVEPCRARLAQLAADYRSCAVRQASAGQCVAAERARRIGRRRDFDVDRYSLSFPFSLKRCRPRFKGK